MMQMAKPNIPVVLTEMEIHWLITRHDLNIHECPGIIANFGKAWSERRREELLTAWDRTAKPGPRNGAQPGHEGPGGDGAP